MDAQAPSVADLLKLARQHGFDLQSADADPDVSGEDFIEADATDEAGRPWIVKVPRRPEAVVRADAERRVLTFVAAGLSVDVPDYRLFTPELIACPRLPGQPAAAVDPADGEWVWRFSAHAPPDAFLDSLAEALASLHAIDPSGAAGAQMVVLRPEDIRAATARRVAEARNGLSVPEAIWRRWQEWIADDSSWPPETVVVHGDLHPGHLLVDDEQAVTAVIDWSESHVGDAATDFSILYASMGLDALTGLLGRYEAAGGRVWPRMAHHVVERWCAYPAVIADFARQTGDDQPMEFAQAMVDETFRKMGT